ncbi:MAG: 50S ribosomal protein L3 [candidate division WOR-3 bacterium]
MIMLIGRKGEMCQLVDEQGLVQPSTEIRIAENVVVARRTRSEHGYEALQLGAEEPSKRQMTKPYAGHFRKAGIEPRGVLREVRVDRSEDFQVGQKLGVDLIQPGDRVCVTGTTRGRGFAGGMRRWGWRGGPDSHGSMSHRRIGSVGSGTSPGRVLRGRTLPGHYGVERVTVKNLRVIRVEPERGCLYVRGAVPGYRGSVVLVTKG